MADSGTKTYKAAKRYIYAWGGGKAEGNGNMKDLLGGKGAGLAEMTNAGLPTPPGFTITTEACNDYFAAGKTLPAGLWDDVLAAVKVVEQQTGKGLGDPKNPLLVSVRSGAKFSMPGMMDTVLNLGLNETTLQGLIGITGNERFGWDAYRRFISMFGRIVLDVPSRVAKGKDGSEVAYNQFDEALDAAKEKHGKGAKDTDLNVDDLKKLVIAYKKIVKDTIGRDFPDDPNEQLDLAIKAVFASWFGKRANDYRNSQKIAHDLGTAVNVVTMVFGNMGDDSGTGVAFTRDPNTGEKVLYGEYLTNAQGEDVVAGVRTAPKIAQLATDMPKVYAEFKKIADKLEKHYKDVQDLEFTIERGRLYMLQTRSAKRTAAAAVKIAIDMVKEKLITTDEALARIEPAQVDQLMRDQFDPKARAAAKRMAKGLNASPGAAVGKAVFHADVAAAWAAKGEKVVLIREETSPDDFHGMAVAQGILTAKGGATSHAAVVARQIGKPCVAGCAELEVNYATKTATAGGVTVKEGDWVSLDGSSGEVFAGALPTVSARYEDQKDLQTVLGWADKVRKLHDLDQRRQARRGRSGPLLRRPGHRPLPHRAHVPRGPAARNRARRDPGRQRRDPCQGEARRRSGSDRRREGRRQAVRRLYGQAREVLQQGDFEGILPRCPACRSSSASSIRRSTSSSRTSRTSSSRSPRPATRPLPRTSELLATIKSMHEQNPMLGLRGCRLGLMIPDFVKIQTRAILNAADRREEGQEGSATGDHDPARRPRERAQGHPGAPRGRGRSRGQGGRRQDRLQVRHHDRDPASLLGRGRDRRDTPSSSASAPTT